MSQKDHTPTGRQIAAARALLAMGQATLAEAASISVPTLKRMEASAGAAAGMTNNVLAVVAALESAGIEFIPQNGGGAGVRLRNQGVSKLDTAFEGSAGGKTTGGFDGVFSKKETGG